jgi:hypothetical protein
MLTHDDIEYCARTDEHGHHVHGTKFCPGVEEQHVLDSVGECVPDCPHSWHEDTA